MEIRNAIAQGEEDSPLYGFLRYRRRNVLIKYLPEECSRLVQGLSLFILSASGHFRLLLWSVVGEQKVRPG